LLSWKEVVQGNRIEKETQSMERGIDLIVKAETSNDKVRHNDSDEQM
jgi:hypothetical protein